MGERVQKCRKKGKSESLLTNCCGLIVPQIHKRNCNLNKNLVIRITMKKMESSPSTSSGGSSSGSTAQNPTDWEQQSVTNKLNNNLNLNNQNQNDQKALNNDIDKISGYKLINNKINNVFDINKSVSTKMNNKNSNISNDSLVNDSNNNNNNKDVQIPTTAAVSFTTSAGNSVSSYPVLTPIKKLSAPNSPGFKSPSDSNGNGQQLDDLLSSNSSTLSPFDLR